jgi:hypothetical protein
MSTTQSSGGTRRFPSRGRRYPAALAIEARSLADAGWTWWQIQQIFHKREFEVSKDTIRKWIDPAHAERRREQTAQANYRYNAANARFRFGANANAEPYKAAFVDALRAQQVPATSIAKVMRVVFDEPWDLRRVRQHLDAQAAETTA